MAKIGNVRRAYRALKLGKKRVGVHIVIGYGSGCFSAREQSLMIQGFKQRPAIFLCAQPIKACGIEALEDVSALAVARRVSVLLDKSLDLLKSSDDAFLAWPAPDLFLGRGEVGKHIG